MGGAQCSSSWTAEDQKTNFDVLTFSTHSREPTPFSSSLMKRPVRQHVCVQSLKCFFLWEEKMGRKT